VEIVPGLIDFVIFTAIVLLWARWAKLDLGLRGPALTGAWPWILLYIAWFVIEWVIAANYPMDVDAEWLERMEQRSLFSIISLTVLLAPLWEELLLRGAMFDALMRRWGIWAAALVPSLLWGFLHVQYDWWAGASIVGSGIVLAIIRWKSDSLYPPLVLHVAGNLLATLYAHGLLDSIP
jgi:membrane protease YdiL (CAAX protease family)